MVDTPKAKKITVEDVQNLLTKSKQTAEMVKSITPEPVGNLINTGEGFIDMAQEGLSLAQKISNLFKKHKKVV